MESDCILWEKGKDGRGYGAVRMPDGKVKKAHRLVWEKVNGPIPNEAHILHRCDNPGCVNHDHLFIGSHNDNMADKSRKLRHNRQILTPEQVAEIRLVCPGGQRGTQKRLAEKFGVSPSTINSTLVGRNNRHIGV